MASAIGNRFGRVVRIAGVAAVLMALAALPGAGAAGGMFRAERATAAALPAAAPMRVVVRMSSRAKRDLDMALYLSAGGMSLLVAGSEAARAADPIEGLARLGAPIARDPVSTGALVRPVGD